MPIVVTVPPGGGLAMGPCLNWIGYVNSAANLPPTGNDGDAYTTADTGNVYVWSNGQWINLGPLTGGPPGPPGTSFNIKGTVADPTALPASGNAKGDVWVDQATQHMWYWNGTQWLDLGSVQGLPGKDGIDGLPAWTNSTADFIVPAIGLTVNVQVVNSKWMTVGEYVWIEGSADTIYAGQMLITAIVGNQVTLLNTGEGEIGGLIMGPPGPAGSPGSKWFYGAGLPTPVATVGARDNDYYLNTTNGDLYVFSGTRFLRVRRTR